MDNKKYDEQLNLGVVLRNRQTKRLIIIVGYNLAEHWVVKNILDNQVWVLYKKYFHLYEIVKEVPEINYPLNKLVVYIKNRGIYQNNKLDELWDDFRKKLVNKMQIL